MLEVEGAKVAQQKGTADEKQFAQQMIIDHTKTSSELKAMVPADMKSALPSDLDDSSQLEKLRDAKCGEDPKLKDWVGKTLPTLQHHLEMAQALDKNRK
jgi:putative membrane protein